MSSVKKKQSNANIDNKFLVNQCFSHTVNSSTPSKSQPSNIMYQTPKITAGGVVKPQYINTQDSSSLKQQYQTPNVVPSPFDYQYGSYLLPSNLMTPYTANLHRTSNGSYFGEAESSFNTDVDDTFENIRGEKKRNGSGGNGMLFQQPPRPTISVRTSSSSSTMFTLPTNVFSNSSAGDELPMSSPSSRHSVAIDSAALARGPNERVVAHVTKIEGLDSSFKLKCNYSYDFAATSFDSIIFSNLNDKLTLPFFLSSIEMVEPFGKVAIKEALSFKIVKDGRKDINTILLSFYTHDALQYFTDRFVAGLVEYKKKFNSKHLILRKCHLESTILSNVKNDVLKLGLGNHLQFINGVDPSAVAPMGYAKFKERFEDEDDNREINLSDRFLLVDTLDLDLVLRVLTLKLCEDPGDEPNDQLYLKLQNVYKVRNPEFKNEISSEHALLLVFDSGTIKQLAVHLFGAYAGEEVAIYDVKRLHFRTPDTQVIEENTVGPCDDLKTGAKDEYIKVLKYEGHLQVSAFSKDPYDKTRINVKYASVKFLSNTLYQRIVFKRRPASLEGLGQAPEGGCSGDVGPLNDPFQSLVRSGANTPTDISKTNSLSGTTVFADFDPELRKVNFTNRLIFISNLPPVVKIFDLVNVVRGGLVEQIRFAQGQKYCFVKFVLPSSANLFYDCCRLRPIVLHGFQLEVDFGKRGLELPPVSHSLLMRISLGATRNIYISLPDFAYKSVYTSDTRYAKYKSFRLPAPEDIIADFSKAFGPLEQINFAKDNHCCWVNFMSIHAALKLMKMLDKDAESFHASFNNRYVGLVFKYGKDRCAKLPKDVYQ